MSFCDEADGAVGETIPVAAAAAAAAAAACELARAANVAASDSEVAPGISMVSVGCVRVRVRLEGGFFGGFRRGLVGWFITGYAQICGFGVRRLNLKTYKSI